MLTAQMLFVWPLLLARVLADDAGLGCFSSIGNGVFKNTATYQTQSACASSCGDDYPYVAIKNGGMCYCLSSLPSSEIDSSNCNVKCNGYGNVMCGGANAYTVFDGLGDASDAASGAASASEGASASGAASASGKDSVAASTLKGASTAQLDDTSSVPATSSTSPELPSTSSPALITDDPSLAHGVSTAVITSTSSGENGSVVYKTITTQTSATGSSEASHTSGSSKKSSNVGPIVGGVVGGLAAVALIGVGIFFFMRNRNSDDDDEEEFYEKGSGSLNRGNGTSKSAKKFRPPLDMPMSNPFAHPTDEFADKHASKLTMGGGLSDPRLNPAMMGRRRLSEGSLADETDYSRKILGVANP